MVRNVWHVAIFSDITEKKEADELIWRHANYDYLTQLPNRRLFRDRLEQEIKITHRTSLPAALFFIDLDRFKEINDTLGHDVGDQLLVQAANRIQQSVREPDTVARMGGDEFTVILSQISNPADTKMVVENILQKLSQPFIINDHELNISASIGVTICPHDGDSAEQLLKNADIAMYAAKNLGRGRSSYYNVE